MSKTNESTKFCIRCPGKDRHLMSCPIHKGGKVKSDEPWHGVFIKKKHTNGGSSVGSTRKTSLPAFF